MSNSVSHYHAVGLGGTFDHFHIGHQKFLRFCAQLADIIYVGVTVPELTTEKEFAELIEPYDQRVANVEKFCQENNIRYQIFTLTDAYGPTLDDETVQAVCVTELTLSGGVAINDLRKERGFEVLPVHVCEMAYDADDEIISSTRIRKGELGRNGERYSDLFVDGRPLPAAAYDFFQIPKGKIVQQPFTPKKYQHVWVVGDVALEIFLKNKWHFSIGVYDLHTKRQPYFSEILKNIQPNNIVENPAGLISPRLIKILQTITENVSAKPFFLRINGEEDLVAVAATTLVPLETIIYYGQPDQGIVEMFVTEELKQQLWSIIQKSDTSQFQN